MSKDDYLKQVAALISESDELQNRLRANRDRVQRLQKEYAETAPFKVGDKVIIETYKGRETVFIGGVAANLSGGFSYDFNKVKKDGTMAQVSAAIHYAGQKMNTPKPIHCRHPAAQHFFGYDSPNFKTRKPVCTDRQTLPFRQPPFVARARYTGLPAE